MSKRSRELCKLRDLCALDLPAQLLVPAFLAQMHELIPSSRNLFDWCDKDGQLTQYYIEGPIDTAIAKHYFEEFHNRKEAMVMQPFTKALRSGANLQSAAQLNHRAFFNSGLYWEIWRPQGLHYRVEAIVRDAKQQALGSLVLYRGPGERCFTRAEEALLPLVLPYLARALSRPLWPFADSNHCWVDSDEAQETLLTDGNGRIKHASPGAIRLLHLADQGLCANKVGRLAPDEHPILQSLKASMKQCNDTSFRKQTDWGLFEFKALRLLPISASQPPDDTFTQIQIRRLEPLTLVRERRLLALDLSPGQTAVCRLLLQGKSHPEVAAELGISTSTVVDHIRKLYKALDVRSVQELSTRIHSH